MRPRNINERNNDTCKTIYVSRNCLLKHVIGGKIGGTERRGRIRKQLPNDLKEKRIYWNLREGTAERTVRRTGFGRGCGPVARQYYITKELLTYSMVQSPS